MVGAEGRTGCCPPVSGRSFSRKKWGGCALFLFLVRRSTYVVYYRWRTVPDLVV